ncbi:MAG: phosphotransferase, partial [Spirochaetales bacterium]|nr:phosphotransferase [Spirochaetales bacterium]
ILDVERAYRSISVDGCEIIGEGANGAVYRIDPETIVKVYKRPGSLDAIRHERNVAKRALICGIPTAISYDIVKVGDNYASVFELIDAKSFSQIIAAEPERIDECIDMAVSILKLIHGKEVPRGELPDQKASAMSWLDDVHDVMPPELYGRMRSLLEAIPDSNHIIHGDFHTKNLMLQDGEPIMIDMDTLCLGNPVFEFAPIFNAFRGFGELDRSRVTDFLGIDWEQSQHFRTELLRRYLGTDDETILQTAERKAMVLGYLRVLRYTVRKDSRNEAQIRHLVDRLSELVPLVSDLAF